VTKEEGVKASVTLGCQEGEGIKNGKKSVTSFENDLFNMFMIMYHAFDRPCADRLNRRKR